MDLKTTRVNGNYLINGKLYPSNTTIIGRMLPKRELTAWKKRTPNWREITRRSALLGSIMHMRVLDSASECAVELPGELPILDWPEDIVEEMEARERAWDSLGLKMEDPMLTEYTVWYDGPERFATTIDRRCKIDGELSVLELKSSKRAYESHEIQLGGQALALAQKNLPVTRGYVVYLRRTGAEVVELDESQLAERGEDFLRLARAYHKRWVDE